MLDPHVVVTGLSASSMLKVPPGGARGTIEGRARVRGGVEGRARVRSRIEGRARVRSRIEGRARVRGGVGVRVRGRGRVVTRITGRDTVFVRGLEYTSIRIVYPCRCPCDGICAFLVLASVQWMGGALRLGLGFGLVLGLGFVLGLGLAGHGRVGFVV